MISPITVLLINLIIIIYGLRIIWDHDGPRIKTCFFIRFKANAIYRKLEAKYNAKYPCSMYDVYSELPIPELKSGSAYIFVTDNAFRIVSCRNTNLNIELPFSDVVCHYSYDAGTTSNHHHRYRIQLRIASSDAIHKLSFFTLPSELSEFKFSKQHFDRVTGKSLYDFIYANFTHQDEYKALNPHVEL